MRHFQQAFGKLMDFDFIDGPFDCEEKPMEILERFLEDGQSFKAWFEFKNFDANKIPDCFYGLETTVHHLINFFIEKGPFDGVICFSDGGIAYRHFWKITQMIDPNMYVKNSVSGDPTQTFVMPKFFIGVASPVFPGTPFEY
jgi:hypothetical protein